MNEKYFQLPLDKQKNLINAGYKIFALYPYKKASMSAISNEAGISKSLLFYYFKNKKEYYLFLFDSAIEAFNKQNIELTTNKVYDLFELINVSIEYKMNYIQRYPYLCNFVARAYYETYEEVKGELDKRKNKMIKVGKEEVLDVIDYDKFKDPNDAKVLFNIIFSIAEGCVHSPQDLDNPVMEEIIREYKIMMESLKKYYYKEEYLI